MAREVKAGPTPGIVIVRFYDTLTLDDIIIPDETYGRLETPFYVLLDATELRIDLPQGFLSAVPERIPWPEHLVHVAVYSWSATLRSVAKVALQLLGMTDRMSFHDRYQDAINHLRGLIEHDESVGVEQCNTVNGVG